MNTIAPEMHAIDLDNTIYQTYPAFERMAGMMVAAGLASREAIDIARQEVERTKGSFDLCTYVEFDLKIPGYEVRAVAADFGVNQDKDEFLFADSADFLRALDKTETPHFIFTKGGLQTQIAKLKSAGLYERPYLITNRTDKAGAIEAMPKVNGNYLVEANVGDSESAILVARRVLIEEDKEKGFDGLSPNNGGWLVLRPELEKSATKTIPDGVTIVQNLNPITEYIYAMANQAQQLV